MFSKTRVQKTQGGDTSDQALIREWVEKIHPYFESSRPWSLRNLATKNEIPSNRRVYTKLSKTFFM